MCAACATMRPARVEQRGRRVTPLADVRRQRAALEHARPSPRRSSTTACDITVSASGSNALGDGPLIATRSSSHPPIGSARAVQPSARRAASRREARSIAGPTTRSRHHAAVVDATRRRSTPTRPRRAEPRRRDAARRRDAPRAHDLDVAIEREPEPLACAAPRTARRMRARRRARRERHLELVALADVAHARQRTSTVAALRRRRRDAQRGLERSDGQRQPAS